MTTNHDYVESFTAPHGWQHIKYLPNSGYHYWRVPGTKWEIAHYPHENRVVLIGPDGLHVYRDGYDCMAFAFAKYEEIVGAHSCPLDQPGRQTYGDF